jgi:hypothetical protein
VNGAGVLLEVVGERCRLPVDTALWVRYPSASLSRLKFRPKTGTKRPAFGAYNACKVA